MGVMILGRVYLENSLLPGRYREVKHGDPLCLECTSVYLSINDRLKITVDLGKFLSHIFPLALTCPHSISLLNQNVKSSQTWTIPSNTENHILKIITRLAPQ